MPVAFIFRHQHGGFDTSHVFLSRPTDEQMAALSARADSIHGVGWAIASEVTLIDDDTVPDVAVANTYTGDAGNSGKASVEYVCSGSGSVVNPEE